MKPAILLLFFSTLLVACLPVSQTLAINPMITATKSSDQADAATLDNTEEPDPETVQGIPSPTFSLTAVETPSFRVSLQAVGDIMLAQAIAQIIQTRGPEVVFAGVESVFQSADILVGNLECVISASTGTEKKSFTFYAPPQAADALSMAGFDLLSLANNHSMDSGIPGLLETRELLAGKGIDILGAGEDEARAYAPKILQVNGLRLAFLAYVDVPVEITGFDTHTWRAGPSTPGIAWADPERLNQDISQARQEADLVIVLLHSGYEIGSYLPPLSPSQVDTARAAIDAGASLVIGSHPHVLQGIEKYHGGYIAYSLGNFVFDGYQGIANASIILKAELTASGIESITWEPVLIEGGLPFLTTDQEIPAIGTIVAPRGAGE